MSEKPTAESPFDLSLGLEGTHVLVTGGCGLIGKVVVVGSKSLMCRYLALDGVHLTTRRI